MNNQTSDNIVLVLPLPPSLNSYYGHTAPVAHRVIKYVKDQGKIYQKLVKDYVVTNGFDIHANIPLKVSIIINFATNHRQDLDNRMKALLDSISLAEVWLDDSQIVDLHIIKGKTEKPGSVIVQIEEAK